jgi:hypothetical protein
MDIVFFPVMVLVVLAPAVLFWRHHDLPEAMALGALVSLAGWSWLAFARFLLLLPASSARTVGLVALAVSVAGAALVSVLVNRRAQRASRPVERNRSQVLALIAGAALLAVGLEAAVPHFGIANLYYDWWEHFDLARFYSAGGDLARRYQDGYTVTSRTPVYNLVTSLGLTAFGDRFSIFQLGTAALAWLWVLPAIRLARRLPDHALALIGLLALSPLVLFATTYPWPKGLVAFFALLSLDRFLALREKPALERAAAAAQFGLAAGLTLMTHEGFAGYLLPLFGLLLWDCLRSRARWRDLLTAGAVGVLVALPWYAWAASQYGLRGGLIGYPVPGYGSAMAWLLDHLVVLVSSMLPITVLFHAYGDSWLQQVFVAYLRTAAGLLGIAFFIRLLARSLKRTKATTSGHRPLLAFALAGILSTTLLLNGWGNGWASAESVYIPAMIALLLVACARVPLTQGMVAIAGGECLVLLAAAIAYMWSPAAAGEANARLAQALQVHFLGQDAWPFGIALLVLGATASIYAAAGSFRLEVKKKSPAPGGARLLWFLRP